MKKIIAVLLVLVVAFGIFSGCSSRKVQGQIIVGSSTDVNGDFIDGWSNSGQNAGIKQLIHGGYETVVWTKGGTYEWNKTAVKSQESVTNADGSLTYTITINQGLTFNDGTPITAQHYLFGILMEASNEFRTLQGIQIAGSDEYVGFEEFNAGTSKVYTGFRLIDEFTFSTTIKAEELPYFYAMTYAEFSPSPMEVLAPGVTIKDDGQGAYFDGEYNQDVLNKTILDSQTGYRYKPMVTSGPYQFVSFNAATKEAVIEVNPAFKGMYDGTKPAIQSLVFKNTTPETEFDELMAGTVDLLVNIPDGAVIERGLTAVEDGTLSETNYPRNGFGDIKFNVEFSPTQFVEVRQAVAYSLDRVKFAQDFTMGHGAIVHGPYGLGQGEYQRNKEWLDANLNQYTKSLDKAKEVLIAGGWIYKDNQGTPYTDSDTGTRYKKLEDGTYMALEIQWMSTTGNPVSDQIATQLVPEAAKVGITIIQTSTDFTTLLNEVYNQPSKKYTMFNLATGYNPTTPYWEYYDPANFGPINPMRINDTELFDIATGMKQIAPGDIEAWDAEWRKLMLRMNELMPQIPIYANIYYDFYNAKMTEYNATSAWAWYYELPWAQVTE